MFSYSSNVNNVISQLSKVIGFVTEEVAEYERQLVIELNKRILALTPVWEGDSIVNYVWSVGSPLLARRSPIGSGPPGHTNSMSLGQEPRRAANEAQVRESLQSVLSAKLPANIYMTNSAEGIVDLEYGLLPTKETSRSPNGMVRVAIYDVMGTLRGK